MLMMTTESCSGRIELITGIVAFDGGGSGVGGGVGSNTRIVGHEELVARSETVVVDDIGGWWGFGQKDHLVATIMVTTVIVHCSIANVIIVVVVPSKGRILTKSIASCVVAERTGMRRLFVISIAIITSIRWRCSSSIIIVIVVHV